MKEQKKEKDNQQNQEKSQFTDRSGVRVKRANAVVGDSMLNGINESRISKTHLVKERFFWAALIKDMHYYLIPVLEKTSALSILQTETKDVGDSSH